MGDSSAGAEAKRQNAAPSDYRSGPFELKGLAEVKGDAVGGWTFEGYFSVFNNVDDDRDVIRPGAFTASSATFIAPVRSNVAPVRIRRQILWGPRIYSFQPECSAAMPIERLRHCTRPKPASRIMPAKVS